MSNARAFGSFGFQRIIPASGVVDGPFSILKAIGGDVELAAGCEVLSGDKPEAGDSILDGDVLHGAFSKIEVASGILYAYKTSH